MNLGGRILLFKTKNLKSGVEVKMRKVDAEVLLPRTQYVATLDDADVEIKRNQTWEERFYVGEIYLSGIITLQNRETAS